MTIFNSSSGNDTFHGNSGNDAVTFNGNAAGYRVKFINGFVKIIDIDSSDGDTGTDILTGIETLAFADRSYTLDGELEHGNDETRVNTAATGNQQSSSITALADGGYVVSWTSVRPGSLDFSIHAQRYDADGCAVGGESRITGAGDIGYQSVVTALNVGGYVIAWASLDHAGDTDGIYAQRYAADGRAVGHETRINTTTLNAQNQPAATALADGGYVITWTSYAQDGSGFDIYARRYAADGHAVGSEARVNTTVANEQSQTAIAALADGGYAITWFSYAQDGDRGGIYVQRFAANGTAVGSEALVNTVTADSQESPTITALADGGYVIAWTVYPMDGMLDVHLQRFDSSGSAVGGETRLNTAAGMVHREPVITTLADGDYVISWASGSDGLSWDIYAQRFDAAGAAVGSATLVNTTTAGKQEQPAITALADGGYIVSWTASDEDGSNRDIYAQRFDADGRAFATGLEITGSASADIIKGGDGRQTIAGAGGSDTLYGGGGMDDLRGAAGNDRLHGGDGSDVLLGGAGRDTFVFNTTPGGANIDTIVDFANTGDVIQLEDAVFRSLPALGTLKADYFRASTTGTASDSTDYILYETDTGKLLYDADGNGAGAAVQFALIGTSTHAVLTAADFVVI